MFAEEQKRPFVFPTIRLLQVALGGVDARAPEQGCMEESVNHLKGRVDRVVASVTEAPEQAGQPVDTGGVLLELVELPAGVDHPRGQRRSRLAAHLQ